MASKPTRREVLAAGVAIAAAIAIPAEADVAELLDDDGEPYDQAARLRALDLKWHSPDTVKGTVRGNSLAPAYADETVLRFEKIDAAQMEVGRIYYFRWREAGCIDGWRYRETLKKVRRITPKYFVLHDNSIRRGIVERDQVFWIAQPVAERRWVKIG